MAAPSEQRKRIYRKLKPLQPGKDYFAILAQNVRTAREAAGLLQADIADRIGVTQQRMSLIEAGKQNITLRTMIALAAALGVEPADLVTEQ